MFSAQILINILSSGCIYLLVGLSFYLVYKCVKIFHISLGITLTLSSYVFFTLKVISDIGFIFSFLLAVISAIILELFIYSIIYKPLLKKAANNFSFLFISLGIYIIIQNIISIFWGDGSKTFNSGIISEGFDFLNFKISTAQLSIIVSAFLITLTLGIISNFTVIGKKIRALSSNKQLSSIFGVDVFKTYFFVFAISGFIISVSGILVASDTDIIPTMGFNLLLFGIVAMIIGGMDSIMGIVVGSFIVATIQHMGAYYLGNKWMDAITYIILILFLIWKPSGFRGRQLKKVEI